MINCSCETQQDCSETFHEHSKNVLVYDWLVLFTSGGNYVKVWDVLSGGRLLVAFSSHQKTITALSFDGSCQRLLSAGLDKYVK